MPNPTFETTGFPRHMRGAISPAVLAAIVVLLLLAGLAAWWFMGRQAPIVPAPGSTTPAATAPSTPATTTEPATSDTSATLPSATAGMGVDELLKAAGKATSENRLISPPGKNALEYYLAVLAAQPDNRAARDALRELFPFATAGVEDQINGGNFDEAQRVMNLLTKADPNNYSLTIMRSKLDAKKRQLEREALVKAQQEEQKQREEERRKAAAAAAQNPTAPATTTTTVPPAGSTPATTAQTPPAAATPTPPPVAAPRPAEPAPRTEPAPDPARVAAENRDVRVVSPPRPAYPPNAARNRQEGWVEVEFTVTSGGAVQNARVVTSEPARVFDREAVRAVEQARFEPRIENGQPVSATLRRRIEFKLSR